MDELSALAAVVEIAAAALRVQARPSQVCAAAPRPDW